MPTSDPCFDSDFRDFIQKAQITRMLDVGPGQGRMGIITKDILPNCQIDCVEIEQVYIDKFNLSSIYNTIYNDDIKNFCMKNSNVKYDLVLFNDILEHLFRSDAMDVIDSMLYNSKFIIVQWPTNLAQDAVDGFQSEIHRSNFTLTDFINYNFDIMKYKKKYYNDHNFNMNFSVLRGYTNKTDILL